MSAEWGMVLMGVVFVFQGVWVRHPRWRWLGLYGDRHWQTMGFVVVPMGGVSFLLMGLGMMVAPPGFGESDATGVVETLRVVAATLLVFAWFVGMFWGLALFMGAPWWPRRWSPPYSVLAQPRSKRKRSGLRRGPRSSSG